MPAMFCGITPGLVVLGISLSDITKKHTRVYPGYGSFFWFGEVAARLCARRTAERALLPLGSEGGGWGRDDDGIHVLILI